MESTGIVRRVDNLGRFVIPKEIRTSLGITEQTQIRISVNGDRVVLFTEETQRCILCLKTDVERPIQGLPICISCLKDIKTKLADADL
ncbi:AbrB/MazE/SpoVT family DNA-binding domain-containing protein [Anaeromassilibacillus senegalensis]|uniref:AbrB/MazE/SpoVT family DNA-binding domain-containing protein n=1 Tax=Anaeromassilibacillus senegalensis TaxID=1673717 RepID=UPI00093E75ED|nr:AbrB/MazE/SpoVT family DNA-binding domain-containing protein [Anaeromassilibacillus senegalensis]